MSVTKYLLLSGGW